MDSIEIQVHRMNPLLMLFIFVIIFKMKLKFRKKKEGIITLQMTCCFKIKVIKHFIFHLTTRHNTTTKLSFYF
jgi:hypothetical protein